MVFSGTMITFSQGGAGKIRSKQFSEFVFWTIISTLSAAACKMIQRIYLKVEIMLRQAFLMLFFFFAIAVCIP